MDNRMALTSSQGWIDDCKQNYNEVLVGEFAHWCPDWDYLPIDETCTSEFECCTCSKN